MNKYRFVHAYAVLLTAVVLVGLVVLPAIGQDHEAVGRFVPFVIDVSQAVPVEVAVPVVLDSGETITGTAPLTVAVDLRVRVDGPHQAEVVVLDAPEPTVVVATATPLPVAKSKAGLNDDVIVGEVRWRITAVEDLGKTLKGINLFAQDKTTPGRFIRVEFEVENLSAETKTFSGVNLVDSRGRSFVAMKDAFWYISNEKQCMGFEQLNPGVPRLCETIFEVAADSEGLQAHVGDLELFGSDEALIDLGL